MIIHALVSSIYACTICVLTALNGCAVIMMIELNDSDDGNWQLVKPVSACRAFRTHKCFLTFNGGFAWHLHKNEIRRADTSIRSRGLKQSMEMDFVCSLILKSFNFDYYH